MGINLHQELIDQNHEHWIHKPLLRLIYGDFYRLIANQMSNLPNGKIVELGSGLGNIHDVIPNCIRTDLFPNPGSTKSKTPTNYLLRAKQFQI